MKQLNAEPAEFTRSGPKTSKTPANGRRSTKSITRVSPAALDAHSANFSQEGLRHHFRELSRYTNPTGGALDKILLNTKIHTSIYYQQFRTYPTPPNDFVEAATWHEPVKHKPIFLRRKAQYQVANHLLGIGQKAYWTGSTSKSTLLGLDIDDHESKEPGTVQSNSQAALDLFINLTGLSPIACLSPGGINAFLICHKEGMSTQALNDVWHAVVRAANSEAGDRGLPAKLECKGKARIFTDQVQYCGVQFKDPFFASNPTDEQIHGFWEQLEANAVTGASLIDLLTTLASEKYCDEVKSSIPTSVTGGSTSTCQEDFLPVYRGNWARACREWALNGLPGDDSIFMVVSELAKWLLFVELWDIDEAERVEGVAALLFEYCLLKNNGYITRINEGHEDEVQAQIYRIVTIVASQTSEKGRSIFTQLRSQKHMKLVPMLKTRTTSCSLSSVKSIECCAVPEWIPAPEYRRQRAAQWDYVPDDTLLPEELADAIRRFYARTDLKINKPTWPKLQRLLNHLWFSRDHEARLGVESLKKMGFSNSRSRKHIHHLEKMGVLDSQGYCPVAGVSKLYRLREPVLKYFEGRVTPPTPVSIP